MKKSQDRDHLEAIFENTLWKSRWAVLAAVLCSLISALLMFYVATVDTFYTLVDLLSYASLEDGYLRETMRSQSVAQLVEVIDVFLLAIVLLIFGLGLYELYISKIDHAYSSESAQHLLSINSLDDLKSRLGKVIMMILIVKFFELAIGMDIDDIFELLMFAGGILLSGIALYVTELASRKTKV